MNFLVFILFIVFIYVMTVLYRAKTGFWYYLVGSVGFFAFAMYYIEPLAVPLLQKMVAACTGVIGNLTSLYSSYFQSGMLFISHNGTNLSLYIDFECSGVIEIIAFLSLLAFYKVFSIYERVIVGIVGTILLFGFNVMRIFIICFAVYFGGTDLYFISHTVIGRVFFYLCTVLLYFYVFTKPQIIRQKLKGFNYG